MQYIIFVEFAVRNITLRILYIIIIILRMKLIPKVYDFLFVVFQHYF